MVNVKKSPNIMSTTGRIPVIAAPTPTPVNPASEIGVSITRSLPNSSTSPESTLNGVPASATSSPMMHTVGSRRISSASASRTACANVSSRSTPRSSSSGINVLLHFVGIRIWRGNREIYCRLHFGTNFLFQFHQRRRIGQFLRNQFFRKQFHGIALSLPVMLLLLGAVILAADVANVVAGVAVGVAHQKRRAFPVACALHQAAGHLVDRVYILSIYAFCGHSKRWPTTQNIAGRSLQKMRVLVVHIIFADINHGQLPQCGEVHHFIDHPLA